MVKKVMDMKVLQKAKNLEALIKVTESNIYGWEKMFEASEITLTSATKPQNMYLKNPQKDKVRDLIIGYHQEELSELKEKFEKL
jgi:hypothetical protein